MVRVCNSQMISTCSIWIGWCRQSAVNMLSRNLTWSHSRCLCTLVVVEWTLCFYSLAYIHRWLHTSSYPDGRYRTVRSCTLAVMKSRFKLISNDKSHHCKVLCEYINYLWLVLQASMDSSKIHDFHNTCHHDIYQHQACRLLVRWQVRLVCLVKLFLQFYIPYSIAGSIYYYCVV